MSLSSLAGNVNRFAPEALTYGGGWDANTTYVLHNVVFGSNNVAYVLAVASNRGTDPTTAPAPSPWVVFGSATPAPPTPGATYLQLAPLNATLASGVWDAQSAYAVGDLVRDTSTTAGAGGSLWVCNTAVPAVVAPVANTSPSTLGNTPAPWTAVSSALTAGAGINLTPVGNSLEVSAVSAGAGGLKAILSGNALTAKVVGGTVVNNSMSVPLQQFDLGLTAGHTYLLNLSFDGGANTTWTGSSGGSSMTVSPYISNTATGLESDLPSLFGYGQINTFSAPVSVSAVANGQNPLIDFPPLTYQVYYPALDANVYINALLQGGTQVSDTSVGNVAWTTFANGWKIYASATDLGLTPA